MSELDFGARTDWAEGVFGGLIALGRAVASRVVQMAATLAVRGGGTVTRTFRDSASREGAYRLLSNERVTSGALEQVMGEAAATACAAVERVLVAVDGSSLKFGDFARKRELGGVGDWKHGARGLHVVSALALDVRGVPLGLVAQKWWLRKRRSRGEQKRPLKAKESRFQVAAIQCAQERLKEQAPNTQATYVLDRGFDMPEVLRLSQQGFRLIVRAAYNRRLADSEVKLVPTVDATKALGSTLVEVPARSAAPKRPARARRTAKLQVHATTVNLRLRVKGKRHEAVRMNVVRAVEVNGPATGAICWTLMTTEPISTVSEAEAVVRAYALRWRIEDMHRTWKRGGYNVERSQLRSMEAVIKWSTLNAAVAVRALHLAQVARENPDLPASAEFSNDEIQGVIALVKRGKTKPDVETVRQMVRFVAELGGWSRHSKRDPGATTIARGLYDVAIAASVIAAQRGKKRE